MSRAKSKVPFADRLALSQSVARGSGIDGIPPADRLARRQPGSDTATAQLSPRTLSHPQASRPRLPDGVCHLPRAGPRPGWLARAASGRGLYGARRLAARLAGSGVRTTSERVLVRSLRPAA